MKANNRKFLIEITLKYYDDSINDIKKMHELNYIAFSEMCKQVTEIENHKHEMLKEFEKL